MTPMELSKILKEMYNTAPKGDSTAMIRVFGIKYAKELSNCGVPMTEIAKEAISESYHAEISKGIRLAKYVQLKDKVL